MSYTTPSRRKDVKNEIKRIMDLALDQQEVQLNALFNKVNYEIYVTCARIDNDKFSMGEKRREYRRLLYCAMVFPKSYRGLIIGILDKAFAKVLLPKKPQVIYMKKINTAHISGLPLPEKAKVNVWWGQDDKLIFASAATEFSLPIERIMGMGTTSEVTASSYYGTKTNLTIEYTKEDKIKYIVVWTRKASDFFYLIKYFDQIKGTREMNKQEL